jgi:serine O-acetyltransferase
VGKLASFLLQILGIYLPRGVPVGADLSLPHSTAGLVVHYRTRIGDRVSIYHHVTVGRADGYAPEGDIPGAVIEDDAVLCAGAVILPGHGAELVIGKGAVVGANAVVTRSIPAGEVWAGNPARFVRMRDNESANSPLI